MARGERAGGRRAPCMLNVETMPLFREHRVASVVALLVGGDHERVGLRHTDAKLGLQSSLKRE